MPYPSAATGRAIGAAAMAMEPIVDTVVPMAVTAVPTALAAAACTAGFFAA